MIKTVLFHISIEKNTKLALIEVAKLPFWQSSLVRIDLSSPLLFVLARQNEGIELRMPGERHNNALFFWDSYDGSEANMIESVIAQSITFSPVKHLKM